MPNNGGSDNLIISSFSKPVKTFFSDIAEIGLDETLQSISDNTEILQKIPIIKWLFIANDAKTLIQSAFFINKYAAFIGQIYQTNIDSPSEDEKLKELLLDTKELTRLTDQSIIAIDRYQTIVKSKLLGELFVQTLKYKQFSLTEYNKLIYSIEYINPYDGIETLKTFYEYKLKYDSAVDEKGKREIWAQYCNVDYSSLANTGLLKLPHGGAYVGDLGGAFITDIGKRFYEKVVLNINIVDYA
jgi:hypothetical protein